MRRLGIQQTDPVVSTNHPPTPGLETTPPPPLVVAYFHKSPIALYDLTAPIPAATSQNNWVVFSKYDCEALELHYQDDRRRRTLFENTSTSEAQDDVKESADRDDSYDEQCPLVGIERLHRVNLKDWVMEPVYWSSRNASATKTSVSRGTWFYAADLMPVSEMLANALEAGYEEVKPWTMAYEAELESAGELGESGEAKLKYNIEDVSPGQYVIYRNGTSAWLGSRTIGSRLVKSIYGSIGRSRKEAFVEVLRGYDFTKPHTKSRIARDRSPVPNPTKMNNPTTSTEAALPDGLKDIHGVEAQEEGSDGIPRPLEVTDLILIIHGIGQKLAETSEGWTFTHAVNKLRLLIHEQMIHKEVTPTIRNDFCPQVLPINWRVNFDPDAPPASDSKQDTGTDMFSLDDITIDAIPAVRDLIGKVVFDIPYYMSHHKPRMIAAVVKEANRIYALWNHNNKNFEARGGRVHIICHSLGSAISFDVLSNQPNDVKAAPSIYDTISRKFSAAEPADAPGPFHFNTHNLICAGSPAAFFLLLKQHHLIPRRNLKEGKSCSDPAVTEKRGTYGCLAAKDIYNVFYTTDPIAYKMNATIDSSFAHTLPPTQIPSTATPLWSSLRLPFSSTTSQSTTTTTTTSKDQDGTEENESPDRPERPELKNLPSQVELATHDFERESLADTRLNLLNENGTLDYALPTTGYLDNQYLSMIYAHQGYWDSKEFARMVVIECGRQKGKKHVVFAGKRRPINLENLKKLSR